MVEVNTQLLRDDLRQLEGVFQTGELTDAEIGTQTARINQNE
jgi:hypothetical protein